MKGRHISDNIRKTFDVINYVNETRQKAIIMSVDFAKCFDTLEYGAIVGALHYFNFGPKFINWSKLFFEDFNICTQNYGFCSNFFRKERGCNQGCNVSPFYFLLAGEIMNRKFKQNKEIKGITINNLIYLISQFADDTALFLEFSKKCLDQVVYIFDIIQRNLGLVVSYDKTLLYRIGSLKHSDDKIITKKNFKWTNDDFSLLGITVSTDELSASRQNYVDAIDKMEKVAETWYYHGFTLFGKVLIINTLMESLFVYKLATLSNVPNDLCQRINNVIKNFLWKGKRAKIALDTLYASKAKGGLRLFNIQSKQTAIKCSWIPKIINTEEYHFFFFHSFQIPVCAQDMWWHTNLAPVDAKDWCIGSKFWCDVAISWCTYHFFHPQSLDEILNQIVLDEFPHEGKW